MIFAQRTGLPSIDYAYDSLGNADLEGLGSTDAYGNQELTGTNRFLEYYNDAWWAHVETQAYPAAGASSAVTVEIKRTRLSGFAAGQLSDELDTDPYQNTTETSVAVSGATTTITTTYPGLSSPGIEVDTCGLRQSVTTPAGLTTSTPTTAGTASPRRPTPRATGPATTTRPDRRSSRRSRTRRAT